MTYRAAPVTQRDGSSLQNSNCRMASIATGIDYQTLGRTLSTGAKMRARQSDQSGGTDSSDAKLAWATYDETLRVRDGYTFNDALADLRGGRLVHLDVWHATIGAPCCVSGSGNYGHTMAVAPEKNGTRWLVADPWCKPPKWVWVEETKLRAGAEKWGSQVYTQATAGGVPQSEDELIARMRLAALELMALYFPTREAPQDPDDTGGAGGRIMFTTTKVQGTTGGGSADVGIYWNPARWHTAKDVPVYLDTSGATKITTIKAGATISTFGAKAVVDSDGRDAAWKAVLVVTGGLVPGTTDPQQKAILWIKASDLPADSLPTAQEWDDSIWRLGIDPNGRYPAPPCPDCPDCPPVDDAVVAAVAARDDDWRSWLLADSPGSETGGRQGP